MSRGVKKWSEKHIDKMLKEGRGQGRLAAYMPWILITDFYSDGLTYYQYSYLTGRNHEFLSDGENRTFVMLEWRRGNIDVREQFPLPRDFTLEVAAQLGVRHQYYPGTHVPFVMTLDFLVTRVADAKEHHIAYSVKSESDLKDPREIELLEIQRSTCDLLGIAFHLIISERLPRNITNNLIWIRQANIDPEENDETRSLLEEHMIRMAQDLAVTQFRGSLVDYCTNYDRRCSVPAATGMRVARILLSNRTLGMDLNNPTPERAPLSTFKLPGVAGSLRSIGGV